MILVVAGIAILAGCASTAKAPGMVARTASSPYVGTATIAIAVTGGPEAASFGSKIMSNEVFAEALSDSLTEAKLFSRVTADGTESYRLTTYITTLSMPRWGFQHRYVDGSRVSVL
jgi:hypothetical protein